MGRRKSGQDYPIWLTLTAVKNDRGIPTHYVGAFVDLSELRQHRQTIERVAAEEVVLGDLLRLSHQSSTLEDFLREALVVLLDSVPWLELKSQGAIFLCELEADQVFLRHQVIHNMNAVLSTPCERIPFGKCLCAHAASARRVQFTDCIDERHGIRLPDMPPHSHYSVPILAGEAVLGVIALYLREGHPRSPHEESFLTRVADVLSMGITRRHSDAVLEHQA